MNDNFEQGLAVFGARLRSGELTSESATRDCFARIDKFDPKLQAFQALDTDRAIRAAKAMDDLLASGTDLGPLMGVPIAVKDIIAVKGLPVTNGSLYPSEHLTGEEGTIVQRLRELGCVILGKTKTVEFALGATGVNEARGTPWNPWDLHKHRIPGGSSSGSAVATASGMCGFALGTDTGGSVRIPACYNGLFGHKTSFGLWPTDGVFSLSSTLDSIGPLCRCANDAVLIHQVLTDSDVAPVSLAGMRFGLPSPMFLEDLDPEVSAAFDIALTQLKDAGVEIVDVDIPEASERETIFPVIVGAELIATLGTEGFNAARGKMDTVSESRASVGLAVTGTEYITSVRRHRELVRLAQRKFDGLDCWISPTCPMLPMEVSDLQQPDHAQRALLSSRNTSPVSLFGCCASSLPIQHLSADCRLPCGLQLILPGRSDSRLLAISQAVEALLGTGSAPLL